MANSVDFNGRPFHFIGIGGIGMSALAQVIAERKLPVSGSDIRLSHITSRLEALGAHIFEQQEAENLQFFQLPMVSVCPQDRLRQRTASPEENRPSAIDPIEASLKNIELPLETNRGISTAVSVKSSQTIASPSRLPQVICSTAIHPGNAEYQAALELGCPIFHRSDVLAALIADHHSIAVSGTHGKTTTSGLIGYLLYQAGLDPTVIIGGEVNALGGNARSGTGPYLVAEADESDGSLVKFAPKIGVITNIELDHPDHYTDLSEVIQTFQHFVQRCEVVVASLDCETIRAQIQPTLSYSLNPDLKADYTVDQVEYQGNGSKARIWEQGVCLGELKLGLLGHHNLSNALAAIAVGRHLGLAFEVISGAIEQFEGARRRFEYRGHANGIVLIDDYAHHPSEIQVTLAAAQLQVQTQSSRFPIKPQRVVAIFQPHRYSRTQALLQEFSQAFQDADVTVVCEVYGAGEANPGNTNGQQVAAAIAQHHPQVHYCASLDQVSDWLTKHLRSGDLALFLGAGNLNQIIPTVLERLERLQSQTTG
jgi:UDP-N-acetylmuramate--alanine ligase